MSPAVRAYHRARHEEVFAIAHAEMVDLAAREAPAAKRALALGLQIPAAALARSLAALDHDLAEGSLRGAALRRLAHYGIEARLDLGAGGLLPLASVAAPLPVEGPLLVISNHPGLFDALALFAAIGREDLSILAARRPLLSALPNLARRLLMIDPGASGSVALKKALRHLRQGGALLHFPAGEIEPDPRVAPASDPLLRPWKPGLPTLLAAASRARPEMKVAAAMVSGVISPRALSLASLAGGEKSRTADAIVPLLQLTFRGFGDVDVRVRFTPPAPAREASAEALQAAIARMAEARRAER
jgi:1-acyl-sn-glycerol-3-phosphate acyltransferase